MDGVVFMTRVEEQERRWEREGEDLEEEYRTR